MSRLLINDIDIPVCYHEGFGDKATITFPSNDEKMSFNDIVDIFKTKDISTLEFYNEDTKDGKKVFVFQDKLEGYTKIIGYMNNFESKMGTINLAKPKPSNLTMEELQALIDERLAKAIE